MTVQKSKPQSKNEENFDALDTEEAHAVTTGDIPSPERSQVHPNGKFRFTETMVR